jgi:hypothetical protein
LYLSPGFAKSDIAEANDPEAQEYYFQKWKGRTPLRDLPGNPGTSWVQSRTQLFGPWDKVRSKVAILEISAYHSKNLKDYSVLAALPSSRVSLDFAQNVLFPQAEAGKRIVICMRSAAYWGLEKGKRYPGTLFAPLVNRGGHLLRNKYNSRLVEAVRSRIGQE